MVAFNKNSTTDEVLAGHNLTGKRILVTGVSAGLGIETARALAAHGAQVIGTARNIDKAKAATIQVTREAEANGGSFEILALDLADLQSVRSCADVLLQRAQPFDLIIANAGVMATPFDHTADGFELQFGTNHLGHFVLANRLASLLRDGGRLINLSSGAHHIANVDLDDPNFDRSSYDSWTSYGRSKTANILFAIGFDERHRGRGIRAAAVHPGFIQTEIGRYIDPAQLQAMVEHINKQLAAENKGPLEMKSVPQGAATSIWAGVTATSDEVGGKYCEDCHVSAVVPDDEPHIPASGGVRSYALNLQTANSLWQKSEELVQERFSIQ